MPWPGKPQFYGVRAAAANIGSGAGNYTAELFQADFPQFFTPGTDEAPAAYEAACLELLDGELGRLLG